MNGGGGARRGFLTDQRRETSRHGLGKDRSLAMAGISTAGQMDGAQVVKGCACLQVGSGQS